MKIVGSGKAAVAIPVDTVVVFANLYTKGRDTSACNKQASDIADEVTNEYKKYFNNIKFISVSISDIRCVDESGILSVEHLFSIRIEETGEKLLDSLKKLEEISNGMEDTFVLLGWEAYVSELKHKSAVSDAIEASYNDAIYEVETLVPRAKMGKYDIDQVVIHNLDSDNGCCKVKLPDTSSDDRVYIFNDLSSVMDLSVEVCREVVVSVFC